MKKLPAEFMSIFMYNYCCSKKCSDCKYSRKAYRHNICKATPLSICVFWNEFCQDRLTCEGCSNELVDNGKYVCSAQHSFKKFTEIKVNQEVLSK